MGNVASTPLFTPLPFSLSSSFTLNYTWFFFGRFIDWLNDDEMAQNHFIIHCMQHFIIVTSTWTIKNQIKISQKKKKKKRNECLSMTADNYRYFFHRALVLLLCLAFAIYNSFIALIALCSSKDTHTHTDKKGQLGNLCAVRSTATATKQKMRHLMNIQTNIWNIKDGDI